MIYFVFCAAALLLALLELLGRLYIWWCERNPEGYGQWDNE